MVCDALDSNVDNQRVRCVRIGHAIARQVASRGTDGDNLAAISKTLSRFLKVDPEDAKSFIFENIAETLELAKNLGIKGLTKSIPYPPEADKRIQNGIRPKFEPPDDILQLEILGELMAAFRETQLNLNTFLTILLEGISRGLGMDSVLLAVVSKDRKSIAGRYGVGVSSSYIEKFHFLLDPPVPTSISKSIREEKTEWVSESRTSEKFLLKEVQQVGRALPWAAQARGKVIAMICADRSSSRELTENDFTNFQFFIKSANAILRTGL